MEDLQLGGLRLIQKKNAFRYGMDTVLLADFANIRPGDRVADFGAGSGILPILLHGRNKGGSYTAFEINPAMAELCERNFRLNGMEDRSRTCACSVEEAPQLLAGNPVDAVISNPPYGTPGATLVNPDPYVAIARHQEKDTLRVFLLSAFRILKGKGRLSMVYPAPQMLSLMETCHQCHLEPKRIRMIHPFIGHEANLCLLEAVKDAKPGLKVLPPLVLYDSDRAMTPELKKIYHLSEL